MGDVLAVVIASAFFAGVLGAAEAAARRWKISPEHARRAAHVISGVAAAALPLFMSFGAVVVLALLFVPFMAVSRRIGLFPAIHGVERATWGEIYFPLGVAAAAALFPERALYGFGVLVMGLSDAAAGIAGRRWGRRHYHLLGSDKTYAGSAAFLAVTFVLALPAAPLAAVILAAVLTVVEGASPRGLDNVLLPTTAAGLLALAR